MAPVRIPEGRVFVPRRSGENVALDLLNAAEELDEDRNTSVLSVSGGYHVIESVAKRYQELLGEEDGEVEDEVEDETGDQTVEDEPAPLGVTADNTNDEIDEYASKLDPAVDVSKAKNKAEKIEILEKARTAPKTDPAA